MKTGPGHWRARTAAVMRANAHTCLQPVESVEQTKDSSRFTFDQITDISRFTFDQRHSDTHLTGRAGQAVRKGARCGNNQENRRGEDAREIVF